MSQNDLEQFHSLVSQLKDQYLEVKQSVAKLQHPTPDESQVERLGIIKEMLVKVKLTESELAPIRDKVESSGVKLPAETRAVVDELTDLVTRLIPVIGTLEKDAMKARQTLAPVIRQSVRAVKMKSAYSKQRV